MLPVLFNDSGLLVQSLSCKCPKCRKGDLYLSKFSLDMRDECPECGFDFRDNDTADGPAVFLMFVLGALLVPLALAFETMFAPPLWVHAVLWGIVTLALTLGTLKPIKSFVFALQFKYRSKSED